MRSEPRDLLGRLNLFAAGLVLVVLCAALVMGIAPNIDTRLVEVGEGLWTGYARDLRPGLPELPECELEVLEAQLLTCPAEGSPAPTGAAEKDPFGGEDPFASEPIHGSPPSVADPFGGEDPFAPETTGTSAPVSSDPFGGEDPFAPETTGTSAPVSSDPFGGEDPFASEKTRGSPPSAADPFGGEDPFAEATAATSVNCPALRNLTERCRLRHAQYTSVMARITPANQAFRWVELLVSLIAGFPYWKHLLVIVLCLGAFTATVTRMHIALRKPRSLLEYRVAQISQLLAHLFLLFSCLSDVLVQRASTAESNDSGLSVLWAAGFLILSFVNLYHLFQRPEGLRARPTVARVLMVIPLYAYLAIMSGLYFALVEHHSSGQAIYLHKFIQMPGIYLGVGLYIWAGILFSMTRLAPLIFEVLRPWGLPPALLAWLVVVGSAVPTAFSGASGIFVMAAGAVIFHQLRDAGASPRLALAATAMSGSLGVVLRPCLVVVLIATLNKQVTTAELFGHGLWVFALTSMLFLVAMLIKNDQGLRMAPLGPASRQSLKAAGALLPYLAIIGMILLLYALPFGTVVNEYTAAYVLPGVLLALVLYDRRFAIATAIGLGGLGEREEGTTTLWRALVDATERASHHIGALLMLMATSVCLGGVIERADVMSAVPESFGTPVWTMVVLVAVMVLVGMAMDAMGAVVLVSVTLATVAYRNGIDPIHFWMVVLVAFELGYLTPPVSLNHLLARQVIGAAAEVENVPVEGLWARYEHVVLPMLVMGTALLLVAFVPFFFY